jgi:hypothetical protein
MGGRVSLLSLARTGYGMGQSVESLLCASSGDSGEMMSFRFLIMLLLVPSFRLPRAHTF